MGNHTSGVLALGADGGLVERDRDIATRGARAPIAADANGAAHRTGATQTHGTGDAGAPRAAAAADGLGQDPRRLRNAGIARLAGDDAAVAVGERNSPACTPGAAAAPEANGNGAAGDGVDADAAGNSRSTIAAAAADALDADAGGLQCGGGDVAGDRALRLACRSAGTASAPHGHRHADGSGGRHRQRTATAAPATANAGDAYPRGELAGGADRAGVGNVGGVATAANATAAPHGG